MDRFAPEVVGAQQLGVTEDGLPVFTMPAKTYKIPEGVEKHKPDELDTSQMVKHGSWPGSKNSKSEAKAKAVDSERLAHVMGLGGMFDTPVIGKDPEQFAQLQAVYTENTKNRKGDGTEDVAAGPMDTGVVSSPSTYLQKTPEQMAQQYNMFAQSSMDDEAEDADTGFVKRSDTPACDDKKKGVLSEIPYNTQPSVELCAQTPEGMREILAQLDKSMQENEEFSRVMTEPIISDPEKIKIATDAPKIRGRSFTLEDSVRDDEKAREKDSKGGFLDGSEERELTAKFYDRMQPYLIRSPYQIKKALSMLEPDANRKEGHLTEEGRNLIIADPELIRASTAAMKEADQNNAKLEKRKVGYQVEFQEVFTTEDYSVQWVDSWDKHHPGIQAVFAQDLDHGVDAPPENMQQPLRDAIPSISEVNHFILDHEFYICPVLLSVIVWLMVRSMESMRRKPAQKYDEKV